MAAHRIDLDQTASSTNPEYRRAPHVVGTRAGDVTVLLDPRGGQYYTLNEVAGRIWELIEQPVSVESVRDRLAAEYDVPVETLLTDTRRALAELEGLRIAERVG